MAFKIEKIEYWTDEWVDGLMNASVNQVSNMPGIPFSITSTQWNDHHPSGSGSNPTSSHMPSGWQSLTQCILNGLVYYLILEHALF